MLLFFCCSAPSLNRYHIFWNVYLSLLSWATLLRCDISGFFFFLLSFFPACAARFMIIPLWHRRPGTAPLTPAIWLSHTTLGYTVAHSAIDWGDEGQLFNTSEQQVLLSSWLFSYLISVPPKKVSCLVTPARRFKPEAICLHSPRMPLTQPWQTCEVRWAMLHCVKW